MDKMHLAINIIDSFGFFFTVTASDSQLHQRSNDFTI